MKITLIIGNGFNYLIESIINQTTSENLPKNLATSKTEVENKIREISSLWKKFDHIFDELKTQFPGISDEELIKMKVHFYRGISLIVLLARILYSNSRWISLKTKTCVT